MIDLETLCHIPGSTNDTRWVTRDYSVPPSRNCAALLFFRRFAFTLLALDLGAVGYVAGRALGWW